MLHFYKMLDGGKVAHLCNSNRRHPTKVIQEDLKIMDKTEQMLVFWICTDEGEEFLQPHPTIIGFDRESVAAIPLYIDGDSDNSQKKYVLIHPRHGSVWVQVEWSYDDQEKDAFGSYKNVTLEDVHSFQPTSQEYMDVVLSLMEFENGLSFTLLHSGFTQVMIDMKEKLKELAKKLMPYQKPTP